MKRALIILGLLLAPTVATTVAPTAAQGQDSWPYHNDWDPYWDFTRHLRDISWSLRSIASYQEPPPEVVPYVPSYPQLLDYLAAESAARGRADSIARIQRIKKERRERTRAIIRAKARAKARAKTMDD